MRSDKLRKQLEAGSLWQLQRPSSKFFKFKQFQERWYNDIGAVCFTASGVPNDPGNWDYQSLCERKEITVPYGTICTVLNVKCKNNYLTFLVPSEPILTMSIERFTKHFLPAE